MPYRTYHPDSHQALPAPSASVSVPVKQVNRGPSMPASLPHKAHSRPMFEQEGSTYFCTTSKASKIECLVCRQSRPHVSLRATFTTSNPSACVGIPQHTSAYLSIYVGRHNLKSTGKRGGEQFAASCASVNLYFCTSKASKLST